MNHIFQTVILAAGNGTRMRSDTPKVLHPVAGEPMVGIVASEAFSAGSIKNIAVTGFGAERVREYLYSQDSRFVFVTQAERLGTAHAVLQSLPELQDDLLTVILCGDAPLIRAETLKQFIAAANEADVTFLGFEARDPGAYGRLIINQENQLLKIVEAKEATPEQLAIRACNSGVMCAKGSILKILLPKIRNENAKGEYYLTDIVEIARNEGMKTAVTFCAEEETLGVNSKTELAQAEKIMQDRLRLKMTEAGVTLQDPASVFFSRDTEVGKDVTIEPFVRIGAGVKIEDRAHIRAFSYLEGAIVGAEAIVGPYARLREGTELGEGARVGNFCETKKAKLEKGAKVNHLSYIGDAQIGANANIGAGTITCNYDGFDKFKTEIGENCFIGSDTALVAPVKVGAGAVVAAGSVVTKDVPNDAIYATRPEARIIEGGATRYRAKRMKK